MSYKKYIQKHFDHAATSYDAVAFLQREIAKRLDERFNFLKIQPDVILDLGSGTGYGAHLLSQRYKKAAIVEMDLSFHMLQFSKKNKKFWQRRFKFCEAEAACLPLKDKSVDIIFSSCVFQWCDDLPTVFKECFRVLKPNGVLMFSSFGPDTLIELKKSFKAGDNKAHVNTFLDMHDIGDLLLSQHFSDPVVDMEKIIMTYKEVLDVMHDLKAMGANTVKNGERSFMRKTVLRQMIAQYEQYRTAEGTIPATFEVIYGHAFKVQKSFKNEAGVGIFPLENLEIRS